MSDPKHMSPTPGPLPIPERGHPIPMGMIPIQIPETIAERMLAAMERAAMQCEHVPECHLEGYHERLRAAFERHCPRRLYTGTPADVDTLVAYLAARQEKS